MIPYDKRYLFFPINRYISTRTRPWFHQQRFVARLEGGKNQIWFQQMTNRSREGWVQWRLSAISCANPPESTSLYPSDLPDSQLTGSVSLATGYVGALTRRYWRGAERISKFGGIICILGPSSSFAMCWEEFGGIKEEELNNNKIEMIASGSIQQYN